MNLKILHLSDLHINANATRLGKASTCKELQQYKYDIIYNIIDSNPADVYVFSGDIFDKPHPVPTDYSDFRGILSSIEHGPILIITGNHDEATSKGCALLQGGFWDINGNLSWITNNLTDLTKGQLPFPTILAPWGSSLEEIKKLVTKDTILILHGGVRDKDHQWVEVEGENGNYELQDLIDLNCKAILLGHHHGQQELAPNIWYAGSPYVVSGFGEENDEKGALMWTFTDDKVEVTPISTTSITSAKWKTFKVPDFLDSKITEFDGYVRVKGEVTEKERLEVIKKIKDFPCTDYKLDLQSKIKKTKIKTVKGITDTERLESYLKAKKVNNIKELLKLDKEISYEEN